MEQEEVPPIVARDVAWEALDMAVREMPIAVREGRSKGLAVEERGVLVLAPSLVFPQVYCSSVVGWAFLPNEGYWMELERLDRPLFYQWMTFYPGPHQVFG